MKTLTSFIFILPHAVAVMSLLWLLSFIGSYFYEKSDNLHKTESFECGFENTTFGDVQLQFKNITVLAFLLIYDLELLLLLPISFNIGFLGGLFTPTLLILATIIYTCIWDLETNTLEYEN
jgi:NADH:ubiquinone oxidoreductase subunit 3 (subunit A)